MVLLICDICQEEYEVEKFLFEVACGHGFCETCTNEIKNRPKCPLCRKLRSKLPPHRVYFTPADALVEHQAQSLSNGLSMVNLESSARNIHNLGTRMSKVMGDSEVSTKLVSAVKDVEERIQYFSLELQRERDEKSAMQRKIDLWYPRVNLVEAMERKAKCLEAKVRELKQENASLQTTNNQARLLQDDQRKLRDIIYDQEEIITTKDREIAQLKMHKGEGEKQIKLLKKKLKALSKSHPPRGDPNDTLLIQRSNTSPS
ncbi:traf interacting [Moniliophthora roreri MCA 2997]|uniref:Traf interacting n=2 Tax=Moniliophthora roreri TaxID=221103 RepID=V2Y0N4_MONRO|nr:traf interacting [Moniliophthora roreri MCA 2997]KAI3615763.1 traf interacting [Moniliophthora roreri]